MMSKITEVKNQKGYFTHYVVIPQAIIKANGWKKGDEIRFYHERDGKLFLEHIPGKKVKQTDGRNEKPTA